MLHTLVGRSPQVNMGSQREIGANAVYSTRLLPENEVMVDLAPIHALQGDVFHTASSYVGSDATQQVIATL